MRKFIFGILAFLGVLTSVSANTFSNTTAGYGYTPVVNGTVGTRSWVSYNSNNLVDYGYNLSDDNYYNIDEFNIRFNITGNFNRGTSYTVTFTWDNYHPTIDTNNFYADWILMTHNLYCYSSSWSSTGQTGSNCFTSSNVSATQNGNNSVNVSITFVPSATFYGLALVNQHGSTFTYYKSVGWEVYNLAYSYSTDGSQDIINNQNQNTQNIINNQDTNTQDIINNQNQNTQDIINNQNENNRVCNKKINGSSIYQRSVVLTTSGAESSAAASFGITDYIPIDKGIRVDKAYNYWIATCFYKQDKTLISCIQDSTMVKDTFLTIPNNAFYVRFSLHRTNGPELSICTNGNQAIADIITSDDGDFDSSNCGLICKLKNLPSAIGDLLLGLFVPDSDFWGDWFDALKDYLEGKLGFLIAPFSIVVDFLQRFLSLESGDVIISIPDIPVPNFESVNIISAQEFNWSELLRSKPVFLNLWTLYLDFIDVFLIINFLNLCYRKYCDIFGENPSGLQDYEFHTSENVYTYDNNTGEVISSQLKERKTRRVKV